MASNKLEILVGQLTFAEGPRWHDGRLYFSDFFSHRVLAAGLDGRVETIAQVPMQPSGLGWMPDGSMLIVSMLDHRLMRLERGRLKLHADLSAIAGGPCNDMVVDSYGRAYVGNFGFDRFGGGNERPACLARVDPDGQITRAAEDMKFPNGTIITPDGRTMVIAETLGARLTAFDISPDGRLSNRRVFAQLDGVFPDGICLDAEGAIWVTDARGDSFMRVFPGGRIDRKVSLGARHSYACMLGGDDRRTLFVCTNVSSGADSGNKREGRIEFMPVDVPGAGLP